MTTMILQVPEKLEEEHEETARFLAAKLYEAEKVTLAQAAAMCSMPKWDFPAVLAQYNIPYFQYTAEDVIADVERITQK